ncbi:transposase [Bacillus toyonensis]|nr:transposase [Bacillus toyonensis]
MLRITRKRVSRPRKRTFSLSVCNEKAQAYNIKKSRKTLNISQSGYYEHLQRKPSKITLENEVLIEEILQIFEEYKGRYGSLRITKVLQRLSFFYHSHRFQSSRHLFSGLKRFQS